MNHPSERIIVATSVEASIAERIHAASWSNANEPFPQLVEAYLTALFAHPPLLPRGTNVPVLGDLVAALENTARSGVFERKRLGERILFCASTTPEYFAHRARGPRRAGASVDFVFALGSSCYAAVAHTNRQSAEHFDYLASNFRATCERLRPFFQ